MLEASVTGIWGSRGFTREGLHVPIAVIGIMPENPPYSVESQEMQLRL